MATKYDKTLSNHFGSADYEKHPNLWNSCWTNDKDVWDRGSHSDALADVLLQQPHLFQESAKKTALVPGCGRGHDVVLLSRFGYDVYGLDVSDTALNEAKKNTKKLADMGGITPLTQSGKVGNRSWHFGDFFKDEWVKETGVPGGKFDLIFDYTFGCALPWEARPAWAARIIDLLAPGGRLVCLEFPTTKRVEDGGPPYYFPPHAYLAVLEHPGEDVYSKERPGHIEEKWLDVPRTAKGLVRLVHIKPERTHRAGMEGDIVEDWVSVWSKQ